MQIIIISGIILGFFYFSYPYINKIYFRRPKLVIEIEPNKGIQRQQAFLDFSSKNDSKDQPIPVNEVIRIYKFTWMFDLIIRNNSEVNAYDTVLLQHRDVSKLKFKKHLNEKKALQAHAEERLGFTFQKLFEGNSQERERQFVLKPLDFEKLKFVLVYKNPSGRKFYTKYDFNSNKDDFKRVKKKELKMYY